MVESLVVDEWIYDTLTADATLQGLLAVDNRAPSYQQGIYLYFAPEKDPISLRQPQVPYIVVRHLDAGQTLVAAMKSLDPSTVSEMTDGTKQLLETQKNLMGMLKTMTPVLAEGRELLNTFSGMFSGAPNNGPGLKL